MQLGMEKRNTSANSTSKLPGMIVSFYVNSELLII